MEGDSIEKGGVNDHSMQLLSGGELSVENVNVTKTTNTHIPFSKLADETAFSANVFRSYLKFPTVMYEGSISPTTEVGTTLYVTAVSPALFKSTKVTRVANIATNFMQWTGNFLVRIIFTKAIFMQTKIIMAFIPGADISQADNITISDMYGAQFHAVMNPDNDNELSFVVPFISGKMWHNMNESTGVLIMKLFQPLVASQPTGTASNVIPFTITLSSDHDRGQNIASSPLTFRYLIAPTFQNTVINQIVVNDLTTQISPQISNTINSYAQYSTMRTAQILPENRYKSMAILPVVTPIRVMNAISPDYLPTAIYGGKSNGDANAYNSGCKVTDSTNIYCKLNSKDFVAPPAYTQRYFADFNRVNLSFYGDTIGIRYQNVTQTPTLNDIITTAVPGLTVWCFLGKVNNTPTVYLAVVSPQKLFDIVNMKPTPFELLGNMTTGGTPFATLVTNPTATMGMTNGGNCFIYITGTVDTTLLGSFKLVKETLPVIPFVEGVASHFSDAYYANVNNMIKEIENKDNQSNFVLCYSTLNATDTTTAIMNHNYANFDVADDNNICSALDARLINEMPPESRLNIFAIYMTIRKGVKVIANAVKFIDGMMTFVDGWLPPNSKDMITSGNDFMVLPLDSNETITFGPASREPIQQYNDFDIITGVIPSS